MYRLALGVFWLFLATAAHGQDPLLPALYNVAGVSEDDRLNIRAGPGTAHPVIGTLAPDRTGIEIIRLSADSHWGLTPAGESSGWVAMGFLTAQPGQSGDALPRPLFCSGTEPFWALEFGPETNTYTDPDTPGLEFQTDWQDVAEGMQPVIFGIRLHRSGSVIHSVISRGQCSDGMSDRGFGFQINSIVSGGTDRHLLTGCCTLQK